MRFEDTTEQLHEQVYGVSFAVKILKNINIEIALVVWNFTGQERYKTLQPHYMFGVSGILLLFDLTRKETFEKLVDWVQFIRKNDVDVPIFLIGSKADLFYQKAIDDAEIEQFVNTNKLQGYYEVSFKTGLNVEFVIQKMAELIYKVKIQNEKLPTEFKLERPFPDRPIIINEQAVLSEYILTLRTVFDMVFNEISNRISILEQFVEDIRKTSGKIDKREVFEEIEEISVDLASHNKKIQELFGLPPVPITRELKESLVNEWKQKRDKLLYRILVFKDVVNFMEKLE